MKKYLFIAAAVLAMSACNKMETVSVAEAEELGFYTMAQNATKGYAQTTAFESTTNPDPNVTPVKSWRQMRVSAFNATDNQDYFFDYRFVKNGEVWRGWDTKVNNLAPVYWPIGKDLEFLAFSESPNNECPALEPQWDGAKKVSFNIKADQNQNDILYAQASGNNRGSAAKKNGSSSAAGLPITFYHAQAWLTFNITVTGDAPANVLKVNDIVMKNIFNTGVLTFTYDEVSGAVDPSAKTYAPKPVAKWDFFTQNPSDVKVADPYGILPVVNTTPNYKNQLNMLVPEQDHNEFVLNYTVNGIDGAVELPFTGDFSTADSGKWEMGKHYTYNITIALNEITFKPTVTVWTNVTGFNPDPQSI